MRRMIRDSKLLFDQHRDTRCGPDLTAKAIVLSSFCQQLRQLGPLRLVQAMLRAWRRLMTQGICSARLGFFDPLTYRSRSRLRVRRRCLFVSSRVDRVARRANVDIRASRWEEGLLCSCLLSSARLFQNFRSSC
jgi:hypothetical protein